MDEETVSTVLVAVIAVGFVVAAPILLWMYAAISIYVVGMLMIAAAIWFLTNATAIFQESVGFNLLVGGFILIGISAILRQLASASPTSDSNNSVRTA